MRCPIIHSYYPLCAILLFSVILAAPLSAEIVPYTIGEADRWQSIDMLRNITVTNGKRGYDDLQLAEANIVGDILIGDNASDLIKSDNQLLITFDDPAAITVTSRVYRLQRVSPLLRGHPYFGAASAIFGDGRELVVETLAGSPFSRAEQENGFQIQFWLNSRASDPYEPVLRWTALSAQERHNTNSENGEGLSLVIENERAVWNIDGFFANRDGMAQSFTLTSATQLNPRAWQHHLFAYLPSRSAVLYYVDGVLHDAVYTTESGIEDGRRLDRKIGSNRGILTIGGFHGALDQFSISTAEETAITAALGIGDYTLPRTARYVEDDGLVESAIIDLQEQSGRIVDIQYEADIPLHGEIILFYRAFRSTTELAERAITNWKRIDSGVPLAADIYVRYIQLRAILRSDRRNNRTPILSGITVRLDRLTPPLSVRSLTATPRSDTSIHIRWRSPIDLYPTQYRVFYGLSPTHFTDSVNVDSETEIILDELEPNSLYYVRIDSYRSEIPSFRNAQSEVLSVRSRGD